jgi:maltodextrin utilization protein YvdJ
MANKPWLKKNDERTIEVMGCKIVLKKMTFGESRKAISGAMNMNVMTGKATVDASLAGVLRTIAQIKDWDLTDENDEKLPITLATFDNLLDEDFVGEVIKKVSDQDDNNVTAKGKKK